VFLVFKHHSLSLALPLCVAVSPIIRFMHAAVYSSAFVASAGSYPFLQRCAASVVQRSFMGRVLLQGWVPFSGGAAVARNVVFVPAWAAEQKHRVDMGTILPLGESGKISKYSAQPPTRRQRHIFIYPHSCV
jgi:hypothetical protein